VRKSGGFEGAFDPLKQLVQVSYSASPGVILHAAAHGWFNGNLVADRWIAEAFASYYAEVAAATLAVEIVQPELPDVPSDDGFPLNAWRAPGDATGAEDSYGLAASLALARDVAAVVGDEALREVWRAAAAGEAAYQPVTGSSAPAGVAEGAAPPPDWRALLDLLEAGADSSDVMALEALWRRWVVRPEDKPLLEARADAREAYAAAVEAAAPWQLPREIRAAMRTWHFDAALQLMDDAVAVVSERTAVETAAAALDLTPPDALRVAFEGDTGLAAASAEAATELAVMDDIESAEGARITDPQLIDRLGLIGVEPETRLATARTAFEAGDLDTALSEAASARATWEGAPGVARGRIVSIGLLAVAIALLAWLVTQRRRRTSAARLEHARPVDPGRR
jgi:hypothetical protein